MIDPILSDAGDDVAGPHAPCVVIRGAADVRLAASLARPFTLLSARGAASFAGCLVWQAIARQARAGCPEWVRGDILDCADAPGRALEALRLGQRVLVLDRGALGFADVCGRAALMGAVVLPARPACFDGGFAPKPTPYLRARLDAFLAGEQDDRAAHGDGAVQGPTP